MIDFTKCEQLKRGYAGANGNKISVRYNGDIYMLKFPSGGKVNLNMHYTNGCISEYLGCHIFELAQIPVQETLLGTYHDGNKEKLVVACKDMTSVGVVLQDFASLKNQSVTSERNGYGTELSEILYTFDVIYNSNSFDFFNKPLYHYIHNENGQHKKGGDDPWRPVVSVMQNQLSKLNMIESYRQYLDILAIKAISISIYRCFTNYKYKDAATAVTDNWTQVVYNFTLESDRYLNGYTPDNVFEGLKNLADVDKKLAEMFKNA